MGKKAHSLDAYSFPECGPVPAMMPRLDVGNSRGVHPRSSPAHPSGAGHVPHTHACRRVQQRRRAVPSQALHTPSSGCRPGLPPWRGLPCATPPPSASTRSLSHRCGPAGACRAQLERSTGGGRNRQATSRPWAMAYARRSPSCSTCARTASKAAASSAGSNAAAAAG